MARGYSRRFHTASSELRLAVKEVADRNGIDATVAKLGLSWDTIARLTAGLSVSLKTLEKVTERLGLSSTVKGGR